MRRNKEIDKLYVARRNVMSVVNQIKFMEELPDRISVPDEAHQGGLHVAPLLFPHSQLPQGDIRRVDRVLRVDVEGEGANRAHLIQSTQRAGRRDLQLQLRRHHRSWAASSTRSSGSTSTAAWSWRTWTPRPLVRALTIIEKNQHRKNRAAEVGVAAGAER